MISDQLLTLAYVALAMILGAAIGFERESAEKPAGLRTHMLVAGVAALLVAVGDVVIMHFDLDVSEGVIRTDPIRIVEAIITGVSFLGAGTIIYHRSENVVEGLTTAASILFAVGVGLRGFTTICAGNWRDNFGFSYIAWCTILSPPAEPSPVTRDLLPY